MGQEPKLVYEFGPFRLDTSERLLLCDSETLPLTPKAFETLLVLVENSGHVLEKGELMEKIWPDTFVEEATLAQNIFKLRRVLRETPDGQQYIETIPRRGYRFIMPVREVIKEENNHPIYEFPEDIYEELPEPEEILSRKFQPSEQAGWNTMTKVKTIVAVVILAGVIFQGYSLWSKRNAPDQNSLVRTIAVLPFATLDGNESDEDDSLGLGMADALITKLSNVRLITVRPTSSVLKYRASGLEPVIAGKELKVDLVLEGRIQRVGDRVRVTVQLIGVDDGRPRWAEKFDEKYSDVFGVQDSISEQVVKALTLRLSNEEEPDLSKHYTKNNQAGQL